MFAGHLFNKLVSSSIFKDKWGTCELPGQGSPWANAALQRDAEEEGGCPKSPPAPPPSPRPGQYNESTNTAPSSLTSKEV